MDPINSVLPDPDFFIKNPSDCKNGKMDDLLGCPISIE
jgi:hypothetical protein